MDNLNEITPLKIHSLKQIQSKHRYPLRLLNTFGFDVFAHEYIAIQTPEDLDHLYNSGIFSQFQFGILGGGSNITFTGDFNGLILHNQILGKTTLESSDEHVIVEFGGGENWHQAVLYTLENQWGGLENLSLIPGTVGASPIQNIGAYGVEIKDCFDSLTAFHIPSGEFHRFNNAECHFGYRNSIFKTERKGEYFITSVRFKLSKKPVIKTQYGDIQAALTQWCIESPTISDISKAVIFIRESKLPNPAVIGNCGSFFKNPVVSDKLIHDLTIKYPDIKIFPAYDGYTKISAGWLIEKAGWKGYRRDDIGVHAKQALVLVNYGNGSGAEIIALAKEIQLDIFKKFEISLEMEVNTW